MRTRIYFGLNVKPLPRSESSRSKYCEIPQCKLPGEKMHGSVQFRTAIRSSKCITAKKLPSTVDHHQLLPYSSQFPFIQIPLSFAVVSSENDQLQLPAALMSNKCSILLSPSANIGAPRSRKVLQTMFEALHAFYARPRTMTSQNINDTPQFLCQSSVKKISAGGTVRSHLIYVFLNIETKDDLRVW